MSIFNETPLNESLEMSNLKEKPPIFPNKKINKENGPDDQEVTSQFSPINEYGEELEEELNKERMSRQKNFNEYKKSLTSLNKHPIKFNKLYCINCETMQE